MPDEGLMEDVDEGFGLFSRFAQEFEVGRISDVSESAGGID